MRTKKDWKLELLLTAIYILWGGWMFMLAVGVVRAEWIAQCPTLGFFDACLVSALIRSALYTPDWKDQK